MGGRVARVAGLVPGVLGVALGVSLLLPATPALAHNSLTGSDPRDGARVAAAPERIELRFLSRLDPGATKITIIGPDNVDAAGGAPTFSDSRVRVPFTPGAAGPYVVGYRVPSSDGHPITGEIRFTLTTGTPADPSSTGGAPATSGGTEPTTPATSPSAVTSAAPGSASASPTAAIVPASGEQGGTSGWLWALGGLVVLTALPAGLLLRRRAARR